MRDDIPVFFKDWDDIDLDQYAATEEDLRDLEIFAAQDRPARGLKRWTINAPIVPLCSNCHAQPASGVELHDYERGGYPRSRWRLAIRFICGAETCNGHGYFIGWGQLLSRSSGPWWDGSLQGGDGWHYHLMEKTWYDPSFAVDLDLASTIADRRAAEIRRRRTLGEAPQTQFSSPRSLSKRMRAWVMERDNFRCRRCGAGPDGTQLVVDHIQPVAQGGGADPENLQTLCITCNAGKSDNTPHEHDRRDRNA